MYLAVFAILEVMNIERPKSKQPLPENAQKVFEGVMFDVYQWEQEMFDGTTQTFEKLKRPDTVTVFAVLDDGKIILTKQEQPGKKPFIGAAGGRVDQGEDILNAAKRELLEETGYEAGEFILWKALQPIGKIEWAVYVFVARKLKKTSELSLDVGEKIEVVAVDFDEFLKIAQQENFYEQEVYRDVVEAMLNEEKMDRLKKLLAAT
ncbi:MAG: NUDIX hydrolase [Candidatus Magasanikbacteria bacterium]|nr:NUDIX hydrolase [Candidatus Magasanikbacteria bacterium]